MSPQRPTGSKVKSFVAEFPEELADCRSFSPDELRQGFPFVHRMLVSALSHEFRASYDLALAERLHLPFCREAQLWRFCFKLTEKPEETIEALAFEVSGDVFPVEYTDASFAAAMAANQSIPTLESNALKQAYLAVYFATSQRVREQAEFHSSIRSFSCPEEVGAERWKVAQEEVGRFATELGQEDLYLRIDRRHGQAIAFRSGLRPVSHFGSLVPADINQRIILDDPALLAGKGPLFLPWGMNLNPLLSFSSAGRRAERNKDSEIAKREHRRWQPEGFAEGTVPDITEITEKAHALYAERRRRFPWVQISPLPAAEEEAQRQSLLGEAEEFFLSINERCEDYTIPKDDSEITVQRRILPFYPGHRLYKVLDRRGGRPRQIQILFAPKEAEVPEGLDRLIPLNDAANTHHMLNSAYKSHLRGLEAIEFLDFFCDNLSARDGAFHIIETVDDVRWRGQAPEQREFVEEVVNPIRVWSAMDADPLILDATLTYAGSLYHASFNVYSHGMVKMLSHHLLCERLEIAPELFSVRTHFFLRPPRGFIAPAEWRSKDRA